MAIEFFDRLLDENLTFGEMKKIAAEFTRLVNEAPRAGKA